jgi:TP901 family phage tail tape measure protein
VAGRRQITIEVLGDYKASGTFGAADKGAAGLAARLDGLGAGMQDAGKKMTAGITLPLIGLGTAALKASTDFNAGMANVATLIPGNTARVKELGGAVQDMAVRVGKGTDDLTGGLYQTISAFGDTADSVKILETNARAARAGLASTTDAINLTSAVTKAYGDTSAGAVGKVADLGLLTVRLGQTTFPELAASIGKVTPMAKELNVSQEELFATMATLTGVTGGAAEVATQMRGAFSALMSPSGDLTKLFEKQGIASGKALIEQRGMAGALQFVADAATKSGQPLSKFLGNVEAQTLALALTGPQADSYAAKLAEMGKAAGTTDVAFNEATQGVNAQGFAMEQMKAKAQVAAQQLGEGLAPALSEAFDAAAPLIAGVVDLASKFAAADEGTQKMVVGLAAAAAAAGPVLYVLGSVTRATSSVVKGVGAVASGLSSTVSATSGFVSGMRNVGVAYSDNASKAQTLGAAVRSQTQLWGQKAAAAATSARSVATSAASSAAAAASSAATHTAAAARTSAGWIASMAKTTASFVASGARMLATTATTVAGVVAGWVVMGTQAMAGAARMAAAWLIAMGPIALVIAAVVGIVALIVKNWDTIVASTQAAWGAVSNAISATWEWIKSAVGAALEFVKNIFLNFTGPGLIIKHWEDIKAATGAAFNWVKDAVGRAIDFVKNIFLNFTGPGLLIKHWDTIREKTSQAFNAVKDAVAGAIGRVVDVVREMPGRAIGALSNIGSSLLSAGSDLISGFINGIRNKAGDVVNAIRSTITDKLPGFVKDALGIRSPSRVFMALGEQTGAGFAIGIDRQQSAVRSAMADLIDLADLGGMALGPAGFVQQRLAVPPAPTQTAVPDPRDPRVASPTLPRLHPDDLRELAWMMQDRPLQVNVGGRTVADAAVRDLAWR